jgi:hypothetical protein
MPYFQCMLQRLTFIQNCAAHPDEGNIYDATSRLGPRHQVAGIGRGCAFHDCRLDNCVPKDRTDRELFRESIRPYRCCGRT